MIMSIKVNCRKRLGIKDRFVIVKLALQHALNPNTERYMFASKNIKDDKIKVSHYSNFDGKPAGGRSLELVSEWVVRLFEDKVETVEDYNHYIRGYNISLFRKWAETKNFKDNVLIAEKIFQRENKETEPCNPE